MDHIRLTDPPQEPEQGAGPPESEKQEGESGQLQASEPDLTYKNGAEVARGGVLGFFIGLAVIVPGVSGSTVAIIFKLYEKLLYALGNIVKKIQKVRQVPASRRGGASHRLRARFFSRSRSLSILGPFTVIGLFAGLMLGAFPAVYDEIKGEKKTPPRLLLFLLGLLVPVAIALISVYGTEGAGSLKHLNAGHYILFLLLGYLVAVTQIVPGLSATALLMAFGYFTPIMQSVHLSYWQEDPAVFAVYACLAVGFLLGLVTFSKLLTTIFAKWRKGAFFLIVGLSLGSIVTMFFNPDVCAVYESWGTRLNVLDLVLGLALFVVGVVIAYLFVKYERKKSNMSDIIHRK